MFEANVSGPFRHRFYFPGCRLWLRIRADEREISVEEFLSSYVTYYVISYVEFPSSGDTPTAAILSQSTRYIKIWNGRIFLTEIDNTILIFLLGRTLKTVMTAYVRTLQLYR